MFRPEQPLIMAGLLAYSFSERLPVLSEAFLNHRSISAGDGEGGSFRFEFAEFDSGRVALKKYGDHSSGYCPGF
jgi:hypothetical protein